ncbi:MAG: 4Fe-4S binding protein [Desulfobacteraceae bacterium]|jgi:NAD-dependent dihydropyrimidine dehydrogenase PreA subunit
MTADIYHRLRRQLDQYSVGFPATASGIELKILERLFTEEQAALYLVMTMLLERPESVADRIGKDLESVSTMLEEMAAKGVLFRLRKGDVTKYAAVPFVIGAYEYQVKAIDRELARMIEIYQEEGFLDLNFQKSLSPLRTIPVKKSINVSWPVAPYQDAIEIIKTKKKIAVANCICRTQKKLLEKQCDKPLETCLLFGSHADYYVANELGRYITKEEAIDILEKSEKSGLVNQPANMINPGGMCNCCGDCCGVLLALKKLPKPAEAVFNNYFAKVISEQCIGCEACHERCQMDAISFDDNQLAEINSDRCIGCGLCVTTCPTEAISLEVKPEKEQKMPPSNGQEYMLRNAKARGTALVPLSISGK